MDFFFFGGGAVFMSTLTHLSILVPVFSRSTFSVFVEQVITFLKSAIIRHFKYYFFLNFTVDSFESAGT